MKLVTVTLFSTQSPYKFLDRKTKSLDVFLISPNGYFLFLFFITSEVYLVNYMHRTRKVLVFHDLRHMVVSGVRYDFISLFRKRAAT